MHLAIDTHVHLYPSFDLGVFFSSAQSNLSSAPSASAQLSSSLPVLMLTERFDCFAFSGLKTGEMELPSYLKIVDMAENAIQLSGSNQSLTIVAGRQIVTAERLEVLALGRDLRMSDGGPLRTVLDQVRSSDAFPVLPWSPGKWLGQRGMIISELIESSRPGDVAFGDPALRPALAARPKLLKRAAERGFAILAGSDPLPLANEERRVGKYFSSVSLPDLAPGSGAAAIEAAILKILRSGAESSWNSCGERLGLISGIATQIRLRLN